jgi:prepilin-type N-terminal cleavage/methylation domain-containing protein
MSKSKTNKKSKKGFTLIELLIVVAIIAILAAIAIPQFSQYRIKGYNAAASSDLRNGKTAEEALFADFQGYGASATTWATTVTTGPVSISTKDTSGNIRAITSGISNNVMMMAKTDAGVDAKGSNYIVTAKHLMGDRVFAADGDITTIYWTTSAANTLLSSTAPYALTSTSISDISGGSATAL